MIHLKINQLSSEWKLLRYGIPTASNAKMIITAAKGLKSDSQDKYISELIAERHAKKIVESEVKAANVLEPNTSAMVERIEMILNRNAKTESMQYGNDMEPKAATAYEYLTDSELEEVGFMMNDEKTAGASLDRTVKGQKKGVEIKCPFSLDVHISYCLNRSIEIDKRPQLQWQMLISELESIDIVSYYPGAITVIITAQRDEEYIKKISEYHKEFYERLEDRWNNWNEMIKDKTT